MDEKSLEEIIRLAREQNNKKSGDLHNDMPHSGKTDSDELDFFGDDFEVTYDGIDNRPSSENFYDREKYHDYDEYDDYYDLNQVEEPVKTKKSSARKEKKARRKNFRKNNREFTIVVYTFLFLFLCLIGYFIYFNVFESEKVINSAFNKRQETFAEDVIKGNIYDTNKNVLATTKTNKDGTETREYPYGKLFAHVVGYTAKGKTGLESAYSFNMLRSNSSFIKRLKNDLNSQKSQGDSIVTTLDAKLQEAAYEAIGASNGAAVVMDVKTGKVLAMVSKPAYDPNTIAKEWDSITKSDSSEGILLNRATQGLYPPGSIFKIWTLLEYIKENPDNYENFEYVCKGYVTDENFKLRCFDARVHGNLDLTSAFAKSCNSAFATLGLAIDNDKLKSLCESVLFNSELPLDIPYSKSSFVLDNSATNPQTMMTAIGQGETVVSPIHMCMLAQTIANKGKMMTPYLVDHVENDAGIQVSGNKPKAYNDILTESDCNTLIEYMKAVVQTGTATELKSKTYTAAGKTGTAEYSSDKSLSHSWFMGFTSTEESDIAIAAVVEGGGAGNATGVSVAKRVFDTYYANKNHGI